MQKQIKKYILYRWYIMHIYQIKYIIQDPKVNYNHNCKKVIENNAL